MKENLAVLLAVRPKWVGLILNGQKRVELRKNKPNLKPPFKVYIYCCKPTFPHEDFIVFDPRLGGLDYVYGGGKIVGKFICDDIFDIWPGYTGNMGDDCLTYAEQESYLGEMGHGYGWHISCVTVYDTPLPITSLRKPCSFVGPCSHCHGSSRDTQDGLLVCDMVVARAPQSWCYVRDGLYMAG